MTRNYQIQNRIKEIMTNNKPTARAPQEDNGATDSTKYYYDVLRYSSTYSSKTSAEEVFAAQNTKIIGIPHQFLPTADFRIDKANNFGYNFARDIYMERPIVTLLPGKVDYLPDFSKENKKIFGELSKDIKPENTAVLNDLIAKHDESRYYDFESDYEMYIRYVNLLCRTAAVYLGIEKRKAPDGKHTYLTYDWANYQNFTNYETPVKDDQGVLSVIQDIGKDISDAIKKAGSDILMGYNRYVNFFIDPSSSVSESLSNTTQRSQLEGAFDSVEGIVKEATMFLSTVDDNGSIQNFINKAGESVLSLANTASFGLFQNILGTAGKEVLHGANLIYPEIWMDSDYSKSYNLVMSFVSPYGDKEAIYLNCIVPTLHALAFALPRQTTANSFTSPFIVRGYCKGMYSIDMGMVESMTIDKGPEQTWSIDGLPTQIKVTMSIKDLYSQLMMSDSHNPILFFNNQGMMDYLGSMCGVELNLPNMVFKTASLKALLGEINTIPSNYYRKMTESLHNYVSGFFR